MTSKLRRKDLGGERLQTESESPLSTACPPILRLGAMCTESLESTKAAKRIWTARVYELVDE